MYVYIVFVRTLSGPVGGTGLGAAQVLALGNMATGSWVALLRTLV